MNRGADVRAGPPEGGLPRTVTVVGCGRLGAHLAGRLSAEGCSVVVIDRDERAFDRLPAAFSGFRVAGDGTEIALLRAAETAKSDCLVAVTQNDNVNLMVAQVATAILGVPRVLVRVFDPAREEIYRDFGLRTVSPTRLAVEEMVRVLRLPDEGGAAAGEEGP
jgi:trk system potassium uptake protein